MRLLLVFVLMVTATTSVYARQTNIILVLGDSLSAAYGIGSQQGWVSLTNQKLKQQGHKYRMVNASVTGDTTYNGLHRLPGLLSKYQPDIVIIELGGNDGLRGMPLRQMENNLSQMIQQSTKAGAKVILAGMHIPPNYGKRYTEQFHGIYQKLADRYEISRIPFLLDSVGDNPQLMQADGIHPSAKAQPVILKTVWQVLEPMLQ
ncbi:MAG: arylesterase [Gammaproteobacteria bacterium]